MRRLAGILALIVGLAGCAPELPSKESLARELGYIADEVYASDGISRSAKEELSFLRHYEIYLVDEHQIISRGELNVLYRRLWFREAVYQLRVAAGSISDVGPNGNLETVMAALDSARARNNPLASIIVESGIGAGRIAKSLRSQLPMYGDAERARFEVYIGVIEDFSPIRSHPRTGGAVRG